MRGQDSVILPRMKNGILFAALALVLCFTTDSFSFGELGNIQQTLIIHNSGAVTAVSPQSSAPTQAAPQKRSGSTRYLPSGSSKRRSKKKSSSSVTSFTIMGKGGGVRSGVPLRPGMDEDVEDLIDRLAGKEERQKILVTAIGQEPYEAQAMLSGVYNELRIETKGGRAHIPINEIELVKFGKRDFNKVAVTVSLRRGTTVKGNIYQKYVFEFYANDAFIPTFANQLSSVKISSALSR